MEQKMPITQTFQETQKISVKQKSELFFSFLCMKGKKLPCSEIL